MPQLPGADPAHHRKHQWPAGGKQAGAVFRGRVQVRYAVHRSEVGIDAVEGAVEVGELVDAQVSCGHRGGRGRASDARLGAGDHPRSDEHTSELQSLMRISYAVFCLKTNKPNTSLKHKSKKLVNK